MMEDEPETTNTAVVDKLCAYLDTVSCLSLCWNFVWTLCYSQMLSVLLWVYKKNQVLAKKNLGDHINEVFSDRDKMKKVTGKFIAMGFWFFYVGKHTMISISKTWSTPLRKVLQDNVMALDDPHGLTRHYLTSVPSTSMAEFWLPLSAFDYSAQAKNGCPLAWKWKETHNTHTHTLTKLLLDVIPDDLKSQSRFMFDSCLWFSITWSYHGGEFQW